MTIEEMITYILLKIGDNPTREGLLDTPKRVSNMYLEIFRGYDPSSRPKIAVFKNNIDGIYYDEMLMDTGKFYSHCEHHMVPFFGEYWFGYIPSKNGNIIGLSKIARLVDYHSAKLQIQERLVNDILEDIWNILSLDSAPPLGAALLMKGTHLCKVMRGVKKEGITTTSKLKGVFKTDINVRNEFLTLIK